MSQAQTQTNAGRQERERWPVRVPPSLVTQLGEQATRELLSRLADRLRFAPEAAALVRIAPLIGGHRHVSVLSEVAEERIS